MDFIPNYTGSEHPWFEASKKSNNISNPYWNYYVWADCDEQPPNNWVRLLTYCLAVANLSHLTVPLAVANPSHLIVPLAVANPSHLTVPLAVANPSHLTVPLVWLTRVI